MTRPRIFLIDDDESVRRAVGRLLRSAGYRVQTFDCGGALEGAWHDAERDPPACLIVDVRMPGTTGYELVDALLAHRSAVPVIYISGDDLPAGHAGRREATRLLTKPFDAEALLASLRDALAGGCP